MPSRSDEKLGIALATIGKLPVHGLRISLTGTCGWFIWCGERSDDADFFQSLHAGHVAEYLPLVEPYLSLPPGYRFVIAEGYEDVWFDPALSKS